MAVARNRPSGAKNADLRQRKIPLPNVHHPKWNSHTVARLGLAELMIKRVAIPSDSMQLQGVLTIPSNATGVVLFAHGSGLNPRNQFVAEALQHAGIGTLLFDLLTEEEVLDRETVFDIDFLAHRLSDATRWLKHNPDACDYPLGYFGASTGAAAALAAAAQDKTISAVVSRGGRPDLAIRHLAAVSAPTLLIVGGHYHGLIALNEKAYRVLPCEKSLKVVPGASNLFEEPGALEQVAKLASDWFSRHLKRTDAAESATQDPIVYANRAAAGRTLAGRLKSYAHTDVVVLGIARGGVPVAKEVADGLSAPLDVIVVRKLGAPGQPELGIGAVVDGDHPHAIFNQETIEHLGIPGEYIQAEIARQLKEVNRRETAYRAGRPKMPLAGKTVIVVDDGIATGSSVRAALRGIRRQKPKRLVLATPVAAAESIEALRGDADVIVCLETPEDFFAVGQYYRNFNQVSDNELKHILTKQQTADAHSRA
jgi:predicted phosphoribosyltransferase/dienelactone hydrolase